MDQDATEAAPAPLTKAKSEPALLDPSSASAPSASTSDRSADDAPVLSPSTTNGDTDGSAPPSPSLISRSPSFAHSMAAFQEDWEAFASPDTISFFDLLEGIALPRQFEKWQAALAARTRRQRAKLASTAGTAKDRVAEEWRRRLVPLTPDEQLEKYRRRVRSSVERVGRRWDDFVLVTGKEKVGALSRGCAVALHADRNAPGFLHCGRPQHLHQRLSHWRVAGVLLPVVHGAAALLYAHPLVHVPQARLPLLPR